MYFTYPYSPVQWVLVNEVTNPVHHHCQVLSCLLQEPTRTLHLSIMFNYFDMIQLNYVCPNTMIIKYPWFHNYWEMETCSWHFGLHVAWEIRFWSFDTQSLEACICLHSLWHYTWVKFTCTCHLVPCNRGTCRPHNGCRHKSYFQTMALHISSWFLPTYKCMLKLYAILHLFYKTLYSIFNKLHGT